MGSWMGMLFNSFEGFHHFDLAQSELHDPVDAQGKDHSQNKGNDEGGGQNGSSKPDVIHFRQIHDHAMEPDAQNQAGQGADGG